MTPRYRLIGILAANEGDTRDLCRRLRDPNIKAMAERQWAADYIEGKLKRPRHRSAKLQTYLDQKDIARHVEDRVAAGDKVEAAIASACAAFNCSRAKVLKARQAHRQSK